MIKSSVRIQRKLFYAAAPSTQKTADDGPEINPLLRSILGRVECGLPINGVMHTNNCSKMHWLRFSQECEHEFAVHVSTCQHHHHDMAELPPGSWRDMLITDPPCAIHFQNEVDSPHCSECLALTIGELMDRMVACSRLECVWFSHGRFDGIGEVRHYG